MDYDEYVESVLRDLRHLLNTRTHWPDHPLETDYDLRNRGNPAANQPNPPVMADFPHALRSVIRYGLPDMTGMIEFTANPVLIAPLIKQAIQAFEERINPDTVEVTLASEAEEAGGQTLRLGERRFVVQAELRLKPQPEYFSFQLRAEPASGEWEVVP